MKNTFYTFDGKNLAGRKIGLDEQEELSPIMIVRSYDVEALFDYYIQSAAQPGVMIKLVDQLPPEKRRFFPKRAALYAAVKREGFEPRYHRIFDVMKKSREAKIGMTFERLDNAARLVMMRYIERLIGTTEGVKPLQVSHKDVDVMWNIMRTEQGLVTKISHTTNVEAGGGVKRMFEKKGVTDLLEAFQSLPGVNKKQLINTLEDGKSNIPKLLSRGGNE